MSNAQAYEDVEAKYETEDTPESIHLLIHIPDGFAREHIGAKVEYDFPRVRVNGERSLGNNRRVRFNVVYQVPEHCDIKKVKGKFDGKTVVITLPKIPGKIPKQEPPPTQQEAREETEPNQEDEKEGTPTNDDDQGKTIANDQVPKSTTETKEEAGHENETSTPSKASEESNPQKDQEQEGIPPKDTITKVEGDKYQVGHEASTPTKDTQESTPQKGQEEIPPKDTITQVETEKQVGQETSTSPEDTKETNLQKGQEGIPPEESNLQKGQEGIPPKDSITQVESENQVGHEASTPTKDTQESMPQNGQEQEETLPKATFTTNAKLQGEEKFVGETDENEEKQKVTGKQETEEHCKKTLESGKPHEQEGKEESKGLCTFEGKKGREINGIIGNGDVEKKSVKKAILESTTTTRARIKEVAASASQAMTDIAKRFNEEDKQRIIYMGAAVLVVALGVYATYKLRTSCRP